MNRRAFFSAFGASLAAAQSRAPLNLLVLMSDQHSPHVLGAAGDTVVRTPHLDRLAANGVMFQHAYCQAPVCVPSRMSFLTGRQPSENRVWTNSDTLPSGTATFAHALGAAGYETALIGRMHFNGADQWHGFERRMVGDLTPVYPHTPIPLSRELLPGATNSSKASVTIAGPGRTAYQDFDVDVTRTLIEYLKDPARQRRPFCAVAGFVLPHSPFVCSREQWDYYLPRVEIPEMPDGYFERVHPAVQAWRKARGVTGLTRDEVRRARAGYYGLVTEFDAHVGRILAALREAGLENSTAVVYTTDHGEMAGENGMWWKFSFYEGAAGVPLIVSAPGLPRGTRVPEIVSLVDVAPTLCELGAAPMPTATGRSLLPLIGGARDWPNQAFSELPGQGGVPATRMIRRGRWKLIQYDGMRPQLFDLESDPKERNDLGESVEHRAIREELQAAVRVGWNPAEITRELAERARHNELIRKWSQRVRPQPPHEWKAPAGTNVLER